MDKDLIARASTSIHAPIAKVWAALVNPEQVTFNLPKLAAPAQRALAGAGIQSLDQLAQFSEREIMQLHGIGPDAINQLRRALDASGLSFARGKEGK